MLAFIGLFFLLPETKQRTLEELDSVFAVPTVRARARSQALTSFRASSSATTSTRAFPTSSVAGAS